MRLAKKILIPTDGSTLSDRILDHVSAFVEAGKTKIDFLRIVSSAGSDALAIQERFDAARSELERLESTVRAWGAKTKVALATGDPAEEILKYARHSAPRVAERVLRECSHPLLLVNPFGRAKTPAWRRILVPLDGSPTSAAILPSAARIARATGAELVLFHAAGHETDETAADAIHTRAEARELLERAAAGLSRVKVRVEVAFGDPTSKILRVVKKERPDLVAMSSRGRSGLSRWILGSVAEQVLRSCSCPVFVYRSAKKAPKQIGTARAHA